MVVGPAGVKAEILGHPYELQALGPVCKGTAADSEADLPCPSATQGCVTRTAVTSSFIVIRIPTSSREKRGLRDPEIVAGAKQAVNDIVWQRYAPLQRPSAPLPLDLTGEIDPLRPRSPGERPNLPNHPVHTVLKLLHRHDRPNIDRDKGMAGLRWRRVHDPACHFVQYASTGDHP